MATGAVGITLNLGTGGPVMGADSDGTFNYEIGKIGFGASGTTPTQVSSANPLPTVVNNAVGSPIPVNIVAGGGSGGTALADASAFTRGTTSETPVGGVVESSVPTLTAGKTSAFSMTTAGELRTVVDNAISAGTAGVGNESSQVVTVQGVSGMTPVRQVSAANTANGCNQYSAIQPATPAVATVKSSAGTVNSIVCFNIGASPVYLKLFDNAAPTLGTTVANYEYVIPGNTAGDGFVLSLSRPIQFNTAIKLATTAGISYTDNTAISANQVIVNIGYD